MVPILRVPIPPPLAEWTARRFSRGKFGTSRVQECDTCRRTRSRRRVGSTRGTDSGCAEWSGPIWCRPPPATGELFQQRHYGGRSRHRFDFGTQASSGVAIGFSR